MFDECLGSGIFEQLRALLPDETYIESLLERFRSGTSDQDWVPELSNDDRWIVITSDRGRVGCKGGKLPKLLAENGIRHVALSPSLHDLPAQEKIAAIRFVWDEIVAVRSSPKGSGFVLRYRDHKGKRSLVVEPTERRRQPRNKSRAGSSAKMSK